MWLRKILPSIIRSKSIKSEVVSTTHIFDLLFLPFPGIKFENQKECKILNPKALHESLACLILLAKNPKYQWQRLNTRVWTHSCLREVFSSPVRHESEGRKQGYIIKIFHKCYRMIIFLLWIGTRKFLSAFNTLISDQCLRLTRLCFFAEKYEIWTEFWPLFSLVGWIIVYIMWLKKIFTQPSSPIRNYTNQEAYESSTKS